MVAKKHIKVLTMCFCTILVLSLSGGCKREPAEPTPEPTPPVKEPTPPAEEPTKTTTKTPGTGTEVKPSPPTIVPTVPKAGELQVTPLVGVGPVTFGMSKNDVLAVLGQPERDEAVALYYLGSKGMSVILDFRRGVRQIDCWSKQYPDAPPEMVTFTGKTAEGIGMGSTREQVIAAYGQPDKTDSTGPLQNLHYDKLRTQFVLAGDKLVAVRMQAPD